MMPITMHFAESHHSNRHQNLVQQLHRVKIINHAAAIGELEGVLQ
jgi:hypothetical protein